MKNIEPPSKEHLQSIISNLGKGAYVIPDFQREFEWNPGDVNDLLRSIFEDYYIGTLLLWRATKDNLAFLHCEPIYGFSENQSPAHIVLDGQQRLSALYYAFFAPNQNFPNRKSRYLFFVKLKALVEETWEEAFDYYYGKEAAAYGDDTEQQFRDHIFPLRVFGAAPHMWLKWLEDYEKYWSEKDPSFDAAGMKKKVEHIFSELLNTYYISYIELDREISVDKVCDIFTRINNTGVDLDIFDLLNALLRPRDINLKQTWRDTKHLFALPDVDKGRILVLQTMSILKQEYCAPKYLYYLVPEAKKRIRHEDGSFSQVTLVQSSEEFSKLWKESVDLDLAALKVVSNQKDLGAITPKFIPYPTLVPILAVLLQEKVAQENQKNAQDKIREWYWASIFTQNYSSSVESQMAQDLREMRLWFKDDATLPGVIKNFRNLVSTMNLIDLTSAGSATYKGILCLLARKGALDFKSWDLPEYSDLDDHHIVPQSWGEKNGVSLIDSITNRTPISDDTNRRVLNDTLPNVYMAKLIELHGRPETEKLLATHLITPDALDILLRDPFTPNDYREYISLRQKAILEELKSVAISNV